MGRLHSDRVQNRTGTLHRGVVCMSAHLPGRSQRWLTRGPQIRSICHDMRRYCCIGGALALLSFVGGGPRAAAAAARWRVVSSPLDSGCQLNDVARVPSSGTLWAVGSCDSGSPVAEKRTPKHGWVEKTVAVADDLRSVAAVEAKDVWAVGDSGGQPLAVHWDGASWSAAATPGLPPGTVSAVLTGVAVTATVGPRDL
jgi:hypothetical protein